MPKTLVIIPTYNERENIQKLAAALFALNRNLDVLIVDDGADGTDQQIVLMQKDHPNLFLIKRTGKLGRGTAVIEGLRFGLDKDYEYFVEMDADFSHDPAELPKLLDQAAPDTVVIGSRYVRGSVIEGWPLKRRMFSKLANIFAEAVLGLGIRDYTDGYRVYPRALIARMNFEATQSRGFIVLSEIAHELARLGARFVEVPIRFVNRRRGASSFSFKEIKDSFWSVIKIKFRLWELVVLAILAASFFVGLTHGLPLTNVVSDESPNVGGVLRAMEHKTILPALGDVPYATVTYLLSYVFVGAYLILAWPFFGFDLSVLKWHLLDNPHELYLVTRISSALLAAGAMLILHRLSRRVGMTPSERLSVVILVMSNIVIAGIFRTTKIWVLSTFLVIWSIYYLYQALQTQDLKTDERARRAVFFSIFLSCLSLANFPLSFYSVGVVLLLLFLKFRKEKDFYPLVLKSSGIGLLAIGAVTFINWRNILDQVATILSTPAAGGVDITAVLRSFFPYIERVFFLFPLLLLPLVFVWGIRDRTLFRISLFYSAAYFVLISITSPWVSENNTLFRHLVPMGFFLGLLLMSLKFRFFWVLPAAAGLSIIYYVFTLVYLTAPTTYNQAYEWAGENQNSNSITIVNDAARLQFPLNAPSAALLQEKSCSTMCRETIVRNLRADFQPLVFDARRGKPEFAPVSDYVLFTNTERADPNSKLVIQFGTAKSREHFSLDNRLGLYFDLSYFRVRALGETIYVYKVSP